MKKFLVTLVTTAVIAAPVVLSVNSAFAGQDECQHGNSQQDCRPDPQPTSGQDCLPHGQSEGNEDHCLTPSPSPSPTPTEQPSPSPSESPTPSPSPTASPSPSPTEGPSESPNPTPTTSDTQPPASVSPSPTIVGPTAPSTPNAPHAGGNAKKDRELAFTGLSREQGLLGLLALALVIGGLILLAVSRRMRRA